MAYIVHSSLLDISLFITAEEVLEEICNDAGPPLDDARGRFQEVSDALGGGNGGGVGGLAGGVGQTVHGIGVIPAYHNVSNIDGCFLQTIIALKNMAWLEKLR